MPYETSNFIFNPLGRSSDCRKDHRVTVSCLMLILNVGRSSKYYRTSPDTRSPKIRAVV